MDKREKNIEKDKNVNPTSWQDIFYLDESKEGREAAKGIALNCFVYLIDIEQDKIYGGWVHSFSDECHDVCIQNVLVHRNSNRKEHLYDVDYYYVNFDKNIRMEINKPKKNDNDNEEKNNK